MMIFFLLSHKIGFDVSCKFPVLQADNSVKDWWNLLNSNTKPDYHNTNAHNKFGENPLIFTQVIVQKQKYGHMTAANSIKNWLNLPIRDPKPCPLEILNQSSTISMHIPSLEKIHWHLLKLPVSSRNKNTDGQMTNGRPSWIIIPHYYRVAEYKKDKPITKCHRQKLLACMLRVKS